MRQSGLNLIQVLIICESDRHDTDPRGVYQKHLKELRVMMRRGVGRAALDKQPTDTEAKP